MNVICKWRVLCDWGGAGALRSGRGLRAEHPVPAWAMHALSVRVHNHCRMTVTEAVNKLFKSAGVYVPLDLVSLLTPTIHFRERISGEVTHLPPSAPTPVWQVRASLMANSTGLGIRLWNPVGQACLSPGPTLAGGGNWERG